MNVVTRWLLAGHAVSALGAGLTLPIIALHVPDPVLYFLILGVCGVVGVRLVGILSPVWTVSVGMTLQGVGMLLLSNRPQLVSAALCGLGATLAWACLSPLLADAQRDQPVDRAFAFRGALMNLGLGIGGAIAAVTLSVDPAMVPMLFVLDGISYLLFGALVAWRVRGRRRGSRPFDLSLLRDRGFLGLLYAHVMYVMMGVSLFDTAVPLLVVHGLALPTWTVGVLIAVLMLGLVVTQLPVSAWLSRLRVGLRVPVLGVAGAVGHLVLAVSTQAPPGARLAVLLAACPFFVITGCGFGGSFHPVLLDQVGRERFAGANALVSASFNLALLAGPPLGVLLVTEFPPVFATLLWAAGMVSMVVVYRRPAVTATVV